MRRPEKIAIRRMTADDIEKVLVVERACFSHPWSAEVFSATLLLPYAHYYVAEITDEDGTQKIIGECGVRDIVGEGEITNVAVHPDWQGFGIASRMLGDVLARSLEEGMTAFTLEVRAGNRPAIALYEKYGFRTEGIRADFYDKPVEGLLLGGCLDVIRGLCGTKGGSQIPPFCAAPALWTICGKTIPAAPSAACS